ncbi:MAG TPA: XRE family transcriptional regulator [Pseudonocardiaceae bacterium]|nr:XRE family transcriptional regulator [Pseudonocardiaceae bacterium]
MLPVEGPAAALARRLRDLRESHWPTASITQADLADALAGSGSLSVPSISSWENPDNPALPPVPRLRAYATFFATARSVERRPYRMLELSELTSSEKAMREQLLADLTALRRAAKSGLPVSAAGPAGGSVLVFPPGENIVVVCGPVKPEIREKMPEPDPLDADHVDLYDYNDIDALMELYGRLSALNPHSSIRWMLSHHLTSDSYTDHLIVLGGVDWNDAVRDLAHRTSVPVRQLPRDVKEDLGGFEAGNGDKPRIFAPQPLEADEPSHLAEDVAQLYRGPNPYYQKRTVMQFNGQFARGTLGAVRALTDPQFRDGNEEYLQNRFAGQQEWCLLTKVVIADGNPIPPDWTIDSNRLYEWPPSPGSRG